MSYKDRARQQPATDAYPDMRCRYCGCVTTYEALSELGARCRPCFDDYKRAMPPAPVVDDALCVPRDAPPGVRWAYRLLSRHRDGEKLTKAQVESYRSVLRGLESEPAP